MLPSGQNMNAANLHVLSNVTDAPQALLEPVTQVENVCFSSAFESMIFALKMKIKLMK